MEFDQSCEKESIKEMAEQQKLVQEQVSSKEDHKIVQQLKVWELRNFKKFKQNMNHEYTERKEKLRASTLINKTITVQNNINDIGRLHQ